MYKIITLIIVSALISSCALNEKPIYPYNQLRSLEVEDYESHYSSIAANFVRNNKRYILPSSRSSKRYLKRIAAKVFTNNEGILKADSELKFYWLKDKRPIVFSLPGGYIFMSDGLLRNYVRNEDVFISIVTYEILKSHLTIYKKQIMIPFKDVDLKTVLKLSDIDLITRNKMNILTYEVLKRSGYDPEARLLWIQLLNKNSIDFSLLYDNPSILPKEEYLFKNYVSTKREGGLEFERSASRQFYNFRKRLMRL